ncbi:MAG: hypothetical protein QOE14_571 [Humisphaera sp.]|nr:hypothetical protein [Humisphaera sp.]
MRKLILGAALLAMVGCAAKPRATTRTETAAATPAPARKSAIASTLTVAPPSDPNNKVIVSIVSQHQTITVTSSPNGLLYSLKDPQGHVQIADATPAKFAELQPELYQQIQHYIAVHADDAPIPSATVDTGVPLNRSEPTATREPASFRSPKASFHSDSFKRASDRPFPAARRDE